MTTTEQIQIWLNILNRINQVKKTLPARDSELETGLDKLHTHYRKLLLETIKGIEQ
jgi:hypothetical protein